MSLLTSWLASPLPDAAIQIAPECVSVAVIGARGGEPVVQGYAIEPLPAGAVAASLTVTNITARPAVIEALQRALERAGVRPRRVALVIPDPAARVSLVRFDRVPSRQEDLEQLIRWQIRKAAPFAIEDACLTFDRSTRAADGGAEFVVVMARRETVREYESVCEEIGMHAGLVDVATLSLLNLFLAGEGAQGDWLVIHAQPTYTSVVILRGEHVIFFRNSVESDGEGIADVVHQTTMYYQDRLTGQGFRRVLLGGMGRSAGALDQMRQTLADRLGSAVEMIDPTQAAALTDRITASPDVLSSLAPLIGVMVRSPDRDGERLMLHTNLSTRPFYNARAVQTLLGVLALIVLAVTLYNVAQIVRLSLQQRSLSASAVQAERDAERLRSEAVGIRARIDPKELTVVAGQAREANAIIDQRTFSWTALFETFEATLPPDVRITAVQPRLDQGGTFYVGMVVEARRAEDLDTFVEALETSGAFHNVLPNEEQVNEEGLLEAVLDGVYAAPTGDVAQPAATAPENGR